MNDHPSRDPPPVRSSRLFLAGEIDRGGSDGQPAGTAHRAAPAVATSLRVLVVEDLPRVQNLLRELIDAPGRIEVVDVVETESDAVAQYERLRPDAVVIDLNLREGSGLGVLMALRRNQRPDRPRPLLIVLTNHALPVLEAACLNAGADHFLDKSHDFHKVRSLLEQARLASAGRSAPPAGPSTQHSH